MHLFLRAYFAKITNILQFKPVKYILTNLNQINLIAYVNKV